MNPDRFNLETAVGDGKLTQSFDPESFKREDPFTNWECASTRLNDSESKSYITLPSRTAVSRFNVMREIRLSIQSIDQVDNHRFTIEWSDGKLQEYRGSDLQRQCPCVNCRGKPHPMDPESFLDDVGILHIVKIGRYALQFKFTKGCSKGIYPLVLLHAEGR